jgi:glycosyltransferase involved in cell wall biosynthesis
MSNSVRKIVFVLPNFQAGGAERVMVTVANHIDRQKFQPVIIVFDNQGPLRDIVATDVPVISLNVARVRQGLFPLARAVKEVGADAVISTMAHLNMVVLLSKPFMGGVPVIVREAVTPSYFSGNFIKSNVLTAGYYFLYPFADRILSPTQMVFDEMPSFFRKWPAKLQRIFNPVNTTFIHEAVEPGLKASLVQPGQRLFVGAGRLVDQKGFDRLFEVLRHWKGRDDWRLIILGEGPDQDKLNRLKAEHGLPQVTVAGFESKPWRYFAAADAFVLPSRHEGLPNVALEALALGAPVVASTSAGGIGEIAQAAQPGDVSLAHNMEEFLALMDKVQPYTGALPRPSLLPECFSLSHVVASYEKIFADVLSKKS